MNKFSSLVKRATVPALILTALVALFFSQFVGLAPRTTEAHSRAAAQPSTLIARESFEYMKGELTGQNGGTGWGAAWSGPAANSEIVPVQMSFSVAGGGRVDGGQAAAEVTGDDSNLAFRPLASPQNGDSVYFSFLFFFNGAPDDNDFMTFWFDGSTTGAHPDAPNIGMRINQGDGSGPNDFFAGLNLGMNEVFAADISENPDINIYFVVGRLFKSVPGAGSNYDRFSLWVNPAFGDSGNPGVTSVGAGDVSSFLNLGIGTANLEPEESIFIDEVRIGATWEDCVPSCHLACPTTVTQAADPGRCGAVVEYPSLDPTGNCTATCSPESGSFFPVGQTEVTCDSSNSESCSFMVIVNDDEPPVLACHEDISAGTALNQCSAIVNYDTPAAADNCPGAIAPVCSPPSGSSFPRGTTTVVCSATDGAGISGSCRFAVTVVDQQAPTIICPPDVVASAQTPGDAGASVSFAAPSVMDNCLPEVVTACTPASGSVFPVGATTVTCRATDASGNSATCAFTVTVFDICLQDDTNGSSKLVFNSLTGQYMICCGEMTLTGTGTITKRGNIITLSHTPPDRRVTARIDAAVRSGSASVQFPAGHTICAITDRDTRNNSCACGSPAKGQN